MTLFGEREELFGGGAAALPSPFDLGPTAREAGAWTRVRRRFSSQGSAEPLFLGNTFDPGLALDQAGSWTRVRRSWEAVELDLPEIPRLTTPQLGALLGAFVLSCALVRPWESLPGSSAERSPIATGAGPATVRAPEAGSSPGTAQRVIPPAPSLASIQATLVNGEAVLPEGAPKGLRAAVAAANRINGLPYVYGGGHGSFESSGYDCSGAVSYALHGGGLLDSPLASGSFASWGEPGEGKAITVYANGGHAYAVIAGLRWDTSGTGGSGPNWHQDMRSPAGYVARHPSGY